MSTLREVLTAYSNAQLRHIYTLWGMSRAAQDATHSATKHIDTLLQRIEDPIAARFVWPRLSEEERVLLYYLLNPGLRRGVMLSTAQRKGLVAVQRFPEVLDALKQHAFIYEQTVERSGKPTISLVPFAESAGALYRAGHEFFGEDVNPGEISMLQILNTLSVEELNRIVARYNPGFSPTPNAWNLRHTIITEQEQREFGFLQQIPAELRTWLSWLCSRQAPVSIEEFRARANYDDDALYTALRTLAGCAVAFDIFSQGQRVVFVPREIQAALQEALDHPLKPRPQAGLHVLAEPPRMHIQGSPRTIFDLAIIVNAVYQQIIQPTQAGTLPKRIVNKVQPFLHGLPRYTYNDEDAYVTTIFNVASHLGLIQCPEAPLPEMKPTYEAGSQLEQWSQLTLVEQSRILTHYWIDYPRSSWLDITGEMFSRDYTSFDYYTWSPRPARAIIVKYLLQCTPGKWYSIPALLEKIWQENPTALSTSSYSSQQRQPKQKEREKWMRADGEVYIGLLASTLYEFGLINLGYDVSSQEEVEQHHYHPDAFMLTELAAEVCASHKSALLKQPISADKWAEPKRLLIVQPNFELMLLEPDMPTLYSVLPFTQVQQIDIVSRLTLTRTSLLRGLGSNKELEEIIETLRAHSQKEIPQNIEYTLHDWARLYKGARLSTVILLEVSSEATADELASSPRLKALKLRRIGPRALVTNKDINTVRNALDKEGVAVSFSSALTPSKNYASAPSFTFDLSG
jgi:hypothetical protein